MGLYFIVAPANVQCNELLFFFIFVGHIHVHLYCRLSGSCSGLFRSCRSCRNDRGYMSNILHVLCCLHQFYYNYATSCSFLCIFPYHFLNSYLHFAGWERVVSCNSSVWRLCATIYGQVNSQTGNIKLTCTLDFSFCVHVCSFVLLTLTGS